MRVLMCTFTLAAAISPLSAQTAEEGYGPVSRLLNQFAPSREYNQTAAQKWRAYGLSMFGPKALFTAAASGAVVHWSSTPPEWVQGWDAYGKRVGSGLLKGVVVNTITFSTAQVFHEDNRYFAARGHTNRVLWALSSPWRARHTDGSYSFSYSSTIGMVGTAVIAREWYPGTWSTWPHTAASLGYSYLGLAAYNVFREYVPDIVRRINSGRANSTSGDASRQSQPKTRQ